MKSFFVLFTALCAMILAAAPKNLALGKKFIFEQSPRYRLTTDANDNLDLTDGKFRNDDIWFFKESVGWYGEPYVSMILDLGKVSSIAKVRIHLAQGHGGVHFPEKILFLAGNTPDNFKYICDIIADNKAAIPPYEKGRYRAFLESKKHVNFKARYIKLIAFPDKDTTYIFTDEVEVIEGRANAPALFMGGGFKGTTAEYIKFMGLEKRLNDDVAQIQANAKLAGSKFNLSALKNKLRNDYPKYLSLTKKDTDFPVNLAQKELAAANQQIMADGGLKGIIIWSAVRWDLFNSFSYPQDDPSCRQVKFSAGEIRNLPVNFTNAEKSPRNVSFKIDSPFPVTVLRGFSADDKNGFFNSNRLEKLPPVNGAYQLSMLPGESIQCFLKTAIPAGTKAGTYRLKVSSDGTEKVYTINVSSLKFPQILSTEYGTWDYLNSLKCHEQVIDAGNFDAAMKLIREYQMNVSWGHEAALPKAFPDMFDAEDKLVKKLDFTAFDRWLNTMTGFKRYALFGGGNLKSRLNVGFDPIKERSRFMARMVSYLSAITAHIENDLKMDLDKFMVHFIDEASTPEQKAVLAAWTEAITRAKAPSGKRLSSFGNPFFGENELYSYPEIDMFQPSNSDCKKSYILQLMSINSNRSADARFGLYSCANRARERDPYIYYGGTFRLGFLFENYVGSSFWNLATGPRDVCEYDYTGRYFTPWYFRGNEIFTSRQYEAIWEGRCDYEYLALFKKVNRELTAVKSPLAFEGKKLAAEISQDLINELSDEKKDSSLWQTAKKRDIADIHRSRIIDYLEKVARQHPEMLKKLNWL
ncbi:MAG: hypothetical protein IJW33_01090 [Lentisphaeria bacterium]|nr:hypothetical protein [Lentisphaeria bacterium]